MKVAFLGAAVGDAGVTFSVWAPAAATVHVVLEASGRRIALQRHEEGMFAALAADVPSGALYRISVDDGPLMADPAGRFAPLGVHGPSQVIDAKAFAWRHPAPPQVIADWVMYELHVGTFSDLGTYAGVAQRLPYLRDLGVNALELMPLADFPGRWNWGYDPAAFFSPSRAYGTPDELRQLVDEAHGAGFVMVLDLVLNHLGPDGAVLPAIVPQWVTDKHRSPWGSGINLDGPGASGVRAYLIANALHWLQEYRFDALRLDATQALQDDSGKHFLEDLAAAVAALPGSKKWLIAEDSRNERRLLLPRDAGGYGLDAVWVDDFHHQVRCALTGEQEGYFKDYAPSALPLGRILREGWLYSGQTSEYLQRPRGSSAVGLTAQQMIYFIQNHDQVGNRARGDRLNHMVSPPQYRAATALLLLAPGVPMLFMGQEWATTAPFQFFTDHQGQLGQQVTAGRRSEFADFTSFKHEDVPDPQDPATFLRSHLPWDELSLPDHAAVHRLVRDLIAWRLVLTGFFQVLHAGHKELLFQRGSALVGVAFHSHTSVDVPTGYCMHWNTEAYAAKPMVPVLQQQCLYFPVPGAAMLKKIP